MKKLICFAQKIYCNVLTYMRRAKDCVFAALCYLLPVQKKVVFISYGGKGYGCNPKYIAEELIRQKVTWDLVWLLRNMDDYVPEPIRKASFFGLKGIYEVATAKVIIINTKNDLRIFKKKGQYVIQTWHGSYSSKILEKDAIGTLPPQYIRESMRNSAQTDLFLSNSSMLSEEYRSAFWCNCEILECGFPRNDILFHWDRRICAQVREELGIPEDGRIVLYAPTFRDDLTVDAYNIDAEAVLSALNSTGGDWYLIVRMHPNVRSFQSLFQYNAHVLNGTQYPDMQRLLLASDILITDYSSTVFEFAVLEKPSYIYAPDVESYQKMRGLKENFFRMPYPVSHTNVELAELLRHYTPETGKENARKFLEFFGGTDRGDASRIVASRIIDVMEGK